MPRKLGFSEKELGVGGRELVLPIARERLGGSVGNRLRMDLRGSCGSGKTY